VSAEIASVEILVDAAEKVVLGNLIFKVERIQESFLAVRLKPNHNRAPSLF